ncbi:N-acetylglucosamine kinase [Capsaspora owczarzaki ATCC 30864]|uniref:N-acetyl-D-glucosamine kinase n=1 Tax=Capsaspora owczarzaki (strain ATCC 30864) TaxID=595528 RepID=A0A0D2WUB3_CAPO3|nr:N-acetylglucosamine kinase [Capsaspora owczarzaki ATCC 30864]KJE96220.1 N-acetylglucosamine kinase [Capsaspora owczarzaki ATCC 30864]|eukprot:XP_004345324.1 N-acetylglucosamine kinase [Capsaspora owczarzaki ATCC 30864]
MSELFGGVEGGASRSTMVISNAAGEILATAFGGSTNHWVVGLDKCIEEFGAMAAECKRQAGIAPTTKLFSLGLSLSGGEQPQAQRDIIAGIRAKLPDLAEHYDICTDTFGAVATSCEAGGIVLIAGTGSNCQLIDAQGQGVAGCGGWGHFMGDEGSAYWIAHAAIKFVFDDMDKYLTAENAALGLDTEYVKTSMFAYFQAQNRKEMLNHFYSNFDKQFFSGFTKLVAEGADKGDRLCREIFRRAGDHLGRHTRAVLQSADQSVDKLNVVCVGSVFQSWHLLREGFWGGVGDVTPRPQLVRLLVSAAIGAARLGATRSSSGTKTVAVDFARTTETLES